MCHREQCVKGSNASQGGMRHRGNASQGECVTGGSVPQGECVTGGSVPQGAMCHRGNVSQGAMCQWLTCCRHQTTLSTHQSAFSFPIHHLGMETVSALQLCSWATKLPTKLVLLNTAVTTVTTKSLLSLPHHYCHYLVTNVTTVTTSSLK